MGRTSLIVRDNPPNGKSYHASGDPTAFRSRASSSSGELDFCTAGFLGLTSSKFDEVKKRPDEVAAEGSGFGNRQTYHDAKNVVASDAPADRRNEC